MKKYSAVELQEMNLNQLREAYVLTGLKLYNSCLVTNEDLDSLFSFIENEKREVKQDPKMYFELSDYLKDLESKREEMENENGLYEFFFDKEYESFILGLLTRDVIVKDILEHQKNRG